MTEAPPLAREVIETYWVIELACKPDAKPCAGTTKPNFDRSYLPAYGWYKKTEERAEKPSSAKNPYDALVSLLGLDKDGIAREMVDPAVRACLSSLPATEKIVFEAILEGNTWLGMVALRFETEQEALAFLTRLKEMQPLRFTALTENYFLNPVERTRVKYEKTWLKEEQLT